MTIKKVFAEEIYTAYGIPTIQCSITLANNQKVTSAIPAGFPQLDNSAIYRYDQSEQLFKKGMSEACDYINSTIAPLFEGKPVNVLAMDSELMDLDLHPKKATVGANTTLAVSTAIFKAQAASENIELFELLQSISGSKQIKIPQPIFSIFEGRTSKSQSDIKEVLLIPQEKEFSKNLKAGVMAQHHTKKLLSLQKQPSFTGSYGSFAPFFSTIQETLNILLDILKTLPYTYQAGINVLASELYDQDTKTYHWNNRALLCQDLILEYKKLIQQFPLISYIQSGIADADKEGWQNLTSSLQAINIVADSTFCTNPMLIRKGVLDNISNTVMIRPEHIGTVSQTIAAIDACKKNKRSFIIASDQGATNDTFTSDLAVGTNADFIKSGGVFGGEHIAKYNRLLVINSYLES